MIIRKGYKFRLNTSPAMESLLRPFAGCNRFLWNKSLALQKERLDNKKRCLSYSRLCNLLPTWKKEHPFLADAPSQALQQTLRDLSRALSETFDKSNPKKFPIVNYPPPNRWKLLRWGLRDSQTQAPCEEYPQCVLQSPPARKHTGHP